MLKHNFNQQHGVMRAKQAAAFLGIGVSTLWKWVKDGRLPKGTRLSARVTVWRYEDLQSFLDQAEGAA